MRAVCLAVIALLLPSAAGAADWYYEDAAIPIAFTDNGAAQFQFACRGGEFTMAYWVHAPSAPVASARSLNLAIVPDPSAATGLAGASFAQDMPLIHSDGTSMVVRGPVARAWAKIAQQARTKIRVAYIHKQDRIEIFDPNDFGAAGSGAAIKAVIARCG